MFNPLSDNGLNKKNDILNFVMMLIISINDPVPVGTNPFNIGKLKCADIGTNRRQMTQDAWNSAVATDSILESEIKVLGSMSDREMWEYIENQLPCGKANPILEKLLALCNIIPIYIPDQGLQISKHVTRTIGLPAYEWHNKGAPIEKYQLWGWLVNPDSSAIIKTISLMDRFIYPYDRRKLRNRSVCIDTGLSYILFIGIIMFIIVFSFSI
jgi:hypothetical protein